MNQKFYLKDWGENWKIFFIPIPQKSIMKKSLFAIIAILVVGTITVLALSPYFTESTIDEAIPTGAIIQSETMKDNTMMDETMKDDTMMDETMMEKIVPMSYSGSFVGVGDGIHDAKGDVFTIPLEDKSTVLRLENFKSTNGPDLFVYLSTDENASEFVNLGELKASSGNQNYEIPNGTDLTKYNKVLIWCKSFGVLFGSAELSSP